MKKIVLTLFLTFSFTLINAQCTVNATNFGNNSATPSYNVSGNISVTLNTNNTVTVNFASNYKTASGPDVRMYLIKSEGKSIAELKSLHPENLDHISFGLVGFTGAQSYTATIPTGTAISEYDTVFFFCLQFTAFWDLGTFNKFNANNCAVLDIDSFKVDAISIYPNPAKNKIHFSNIEAGAAEIRIFNVLGKQVFHQTKLSSKTLDISSFKSGIYIVKLAIDGKSKTQKLVIQ